MELDLVLAEDRPAHEVGLWLSELLEQLRAGDRLHVAIQLADGPADELTGGDPMGEDEERLSDVIRETCLPDGEHSYEAFKDLATLQAKYPKVYEAIKREAKLRPTMNGPDGVLEKIAKPFLDGELAKLRAEKPVAQAE